MKTEMTLPNAAYDPAVAARSLRAGGVALLPTDTNYALGCLPHDEAVCAKLYAIKRRPAEKPLTLFVRHAAEGRSYADLTPQEEQVFKDLTGRFWPGPLNLIVRAGPRAPRHKYFDRTTISLVCNRNKALLDLLGAVDGPLALTSANISGASVEGLVSAELAAQWFGNKIDVFVPAVESKSETTQSSTIVSLVGGLLRIVRQGDVYLHDGVGPRSHQP